MPTSHHQESGQPLQRSPRQRRLMRARMVSAGGTARDITIRNLSLMGLGGNFSSMPPEVGEQVTVYFAREVTVTGVLRWVEGKAFGMQFDCEIDTHTIDQLIASKNADLSPAVENGAWEVSRFYRAYANDLPQPDPKRLRLI